MPFSERQLRFIATCRLLFRKFSNDRCTTYAAALAFFSMFSIVPFLAILLAVLKPLDVQTTLAPIILSNISLGSHEMRYIHNTRVGSLGVIGLAALLFSIMSALDSVEEAFNQIWDLSETRPIT
jgi:membrane protein